MKISISNSLIDNVCGSFVGAAATLAGAAKRHGISKPKDSGVKFKDLPLVSNIDNYISPFITVIRNTDSVDIEINDEALERAALIYANAMTRSADPLCKLLSIGKQYTKDLDNLAQEYIKKDSTDTSDTTSDEEESKAEKTVKSFDVDTVEPVVDSEKEHVFYVKELDKQVAATAVTVYRVGESIPYHVSKYKIEEILTRSNALKDYQYHTMELPLSVINAVRKYYNVSEITVESNEKAQELPKEAQAEKE